MDMFYTEKASIMPRVSHLDPNRLYAGKFDGNWLRIQLNSVLDHATVIPNYKILFHKRNLNPQANYRLTNY